jgi:hypothetical protein
VVPERLHERDDLGVCPWPLGCAGREHRDGDAQVGQVPDAALGQVDVVVEEHVARPHRVEREVAGHRVDQRGVGPAGQLAQVTVVDPGPEVVGVADHRRPRGAPDRGLDLHLDRRQRALHDLEHHRVDVAHPCLRTSRLPNRSTAARKPGCTGTVEPNSSMTAGPSTASSGASSGRQ